MEVQLSRSLRPVPTWRKLAGLGDDPRVNPTTIWLPGTGAGSGWLTEAGNPASAISGPAVYVAPTYVPVPACTQDTRPGGAAFSSECIAQVLAAQQANMAADNSANRAVFEANCNRDWAMNAERFRELGLIVPPNDCAFRGYGQTIPGISPGNTGSYSGYLPGTPQEIIDWRNANPGGGSPGPVDGSAAAASGAGGGWTQQTLTPVATQTPAPVSQSLTSQIRAAFAQVPGGSVTVGGESIPWLVLGGGAILLFLLVKK